MRRLRRAISHPPDIAEKEPKHAEQRLPSGTIPGRATRHHARHARIRHQEGLDHARHLRIRRDFVLALGTFAVGTDAFIVSAFLPAMAGACTSAPPAAGQWWISFSLAYSLLSPVIASLTSAVPRRQPSSSQRCFWVSRISALRSRDPVRPDPSADRRSRRCRNLHAECRRGRRSTGTAGTEGRGLRSSLVG